MAALAFALSVVALAPSVGKSLSASQGVGQGVLYTFDSYECIGGNTQFQDCEWIGTVEADFGNFTQDRVVFRDDPPADVQEGVTIEASWSQDDPNSAYDLDASDVWRTTMGSTVLSSIGTVVFVLLAIYWWRRVAREGRSQPDKSAPSAVERSDDSVKVVNS